MHLLSNHEVLMKTRLAGALAALALLAPAAAAAQSGGYIATLGRDTVAVESYTWAPGSLTGTSVLRTPRTQVRSYEMTLAPDGSPQRFHMVAKRPDGVVMQEVTYDYAPDSVIVTMKRDTLSRRMAVAAKGSPAPFFEDLFAPWGAVVRRATGDSTVLLAGRQTLTFGVVRTAGASRFTWPQWGTAVVQTDARGNVRGLDFTGTTTKFVVARVGNVDVPTLAASFAAREQVGGGLGQLSPRDTARAEIAGAHLLVDYSRPSARGRTVFGGIVPWGQVWRTGANAATQLVTDRDLDIGGAAVPAGTYTLWTIPGPTGWKLVINKQHGQWGTVYDPAQDLARVDLATAALPQPVERFTFDIVPGENGGVLSYSWAGTRAVVPFRVK
jgi:hypothetical protein